MTFPLVELCFGTGAPDSASASGPHDRTWQARHDRAMVTAEQTAQETDRHDAQLVDRLRSGDATAFDHLVDRYFDRLSRFAFGITGTREVGEDIAQDVLFRVWTLGATWRPARANESIAAYLFRAARNRALNALSHDRVHARAADHIAQTVDVAPSADDTLISVERVTMLRAAIARLPERRRTALRLRYEEGLTYPSIATVMGMSVKSAEQLVALTIKTLRKELGTTV